MRKLILCLGLVPLMSTPAFAQGAVECPAWVSSILNATSALWFIGFAALAVGAVTLLIHLFDIKWLSGKVLGLLGCVVGVGFMCDGTALPPILTSLTEPAIVHFIGALALCFGVGAIFLEEDEEGWMWAILTPAYIAATILLATPMFGFFAALSLVAGFASTPLCHMVSRLCGYDKDDKGPGITLLAVIMTAAVTWALWFAIPLGVGELLVPGVIWVYSLIAVFGLIIMSSRWYGRNIEPWLPHHVMVQIVALAFLASAFYAGAVFDEPVLLYGATIGAVAWILVKFVELMPSNRIAYGIAFCVIGGAFIMGSDRIREYWPSIEQFIASLRA